MRLLQGQLSRTQGRRHCPARWRFTRPGGAFPAAASGVVSKVPHPRPRAISSNERRVVSRSLTARSTRIRWTQRTGDIPVVRSNRRANVRGARPASAKSPTVKACPSRPRAHRSATYPLVGGGEEGDGHIPRLRSRALPAASRAHCSASFRIRMLRDHRQHRAAPWPRRRWSCRSVTTIASVSSTPSDRGGRRARATREAVARRASRRPAEATRNTPEHEVAISAPRPYPFNRRSRAASASLRAIPAKTAASSLSASPGTMMTSAGPAAPPACSPRRRAPCARPLRDRKRRGRPRANRRRLAVSSSSKVMATSKVSRLRTRGDRSRSARKAASTGSAHGGGEQLQPLIDRRALQRAAEKGENEKRFPRCLGARIKGRQQQRHDRIDDRPWQDRRKPVPDHGFLRACRSVPTEPE